MQQKFANLLVTNEGRKTAYECAIEAGYSPDRARITASELRNPKLYPLVVKYIGEIREEYQKNGVTRIFTDYIKTKDKPTFDSIGNTTIIPTAVITSIKKLS